MPHRTLPTFRITTPLAVAVAVLLIPAAAHASGSGVPWEAPLTTILDSVTGPVAKVVGAGAILASGFTMAIGDAQGGFKKMLQAAMGLSVGFAAVSWGLPLFGFGGGAAW